MKMTRLAAIVTLVIALFAVTAQAGDLIQKTDGKWLPSDPEGKVPGPADFEKSTLTVTDENYDITNYFYKIDGKAVRQKIDTDAVATVWYENKPTAYVEASALMGQGQYDLALQRLDSVAGTSSSPDWAKMYALWDMGRIYQVGMGDFNSALGIWDRLKREFPKSKFLPDSIIYAGKALLAMNRAPDAKNKFLELERLPGLPEGKKMLGRYYVIYITQKQGEASENGAVINQALSEYRRLLSEVESNPALKEVTTLARLGIGDCQLALGQFSDALDFFKKIADSATDKGVLAGAFNGLGRCHIEIGRATPDKAKAAQSFKNALLAFLRTVVLYDEIPEQTAMALALAADSYAYIRSGDDWKDRAKDLYRECMAKFPGTEWARHADKGLQTLR